MSRVIGHNLTHREAFNLLGELPLDRQEEVISLAERTLEAETEVEALYQRVEELEAELRMFDAFNDFDPLIIRSMVREIKSATHFCGHCGKRNPRLVTEDTGYGATEYEGVWDDDRREVEVSACCQWQLFADPGLKTPIDFVE